MSFREKPKCQRSIIRRGCFRKGKGQTCFSLGWCAEKKASDLDFLAAAHCLTLAYYFFLNPKNIPTAPAPVDGRYPERMCLSPSAP